MALEHLPRNTQHLSTTQELHDNAVRYRERAETKASQTYWTGYADALALLLERKQTAEHVDRAIRSHIGNHMPTSTRTRPSHRLVAQELRRKIFHELLAQLDKQAQKRRP